MMTKRKMKSKDLGGTTGITIVNLSILKSGKAKKPSEIQHSAIRKILNCQLSRYLEYVEE